MPHYFCNAAAGTTRRAHSSSAEIAIRCISGRGKKGSALRPYWPQWSGTCRPAGAGSVGG